MNVTNKQNITPLELVSEILNINAITLLLKAEADPIQFDGAVKFDWIALLL